MARTGCRLLVLAVCLAAAPWLAQATTDCNWKPECPATGSVKFPIPCKNNCKRYFQCTDGVLKIDSCFGTRKFNPELLTCQWTLSFTGDCDWFLWNDATQINCPFEPQCPAKGESKIALPCEGQCNQYANCKDGRWKVETCSWAHHMFDHVTGECRTKSEVDCDWWKPTESPDQTPKPTEEPLTTAPPSSPTSPPAITTPQPAITTSQPAITTSPPAITTSQSANPTLPPAITTSQPANPTSPPASPTSPPATAPPSSEPSPTEPAPVTPTNATPICGEAPKCPEKGHARLPVPCPGACQRYYDCLDGKYTEMSCKPWENFDPVKGKCTLFYGVDCSQYAPTTPAPTSKPPKPDKPCDFKPACPASGSAKIADPCPNRCQWYYECSQGKAVSKQCLPWENFDPVSLLCTLFWTVDCTWGQHVTPTPPGPPQTTTPRVTTPKPFIPGCAFTPACPATGSSQLAIPCPGHCTDYVQCTNGKPTIETCSLWRNFDPKSLSCALWGVDCSWYLKPQPTKPSLLIGKLLRS